MKRLNLAMLLGLTSTVLLAGGSHEHDHAEEKFSVGMPGKGQPDRRIAVSMNDAMRFKFTPALDSLRAGETIEFLVRNEGVMRHEFSIGNAADQARHAAMMRKMPGMIHEDPNTVSLGPGESATISWRFIGRDSVVFACNIPGHFEAGMGHNVALGGDG